MNHRKQPSPTTRSRVMTSPQITPWLSVALLVSLVGCSESADLTAGAQAPPRDEGNAGAERCFGANDCPPGWQCNEFGYCSPLSAADGGVGGDAQPAEVEEDREAPQGGKRYVYVAIAEQDMVVKIDSKTLQVRTIKVGDNPGALRTVGGEDLALLLDRDDATATLLRSKADGSDEVLTLPTARGLNRLAVSPDGRFAVAYFVVSREASELPGDTFQEVTLLRLASHQSVDLSVGYRPSGVQFSADGTRAFVITEQGVSVIDLAETVAPAIVPTISYFEDPLTEAKPEEVRVTPDGELALLRQPGVAGLRAVELSTGEIHDLPLPGVPSDLDLTPDGKLALAVLRDQRQLAIIDLERFLAEPGPGAIEILQSEHRFGQATLTGDGRRVFLFTNATDDEVLLVVDLATRTLAAIPLQKAVRAVRPAPDGKTAMILHSKKPGPPTTTDNLEDYVDRRHGYSLLDVESGFVKLQLTDAAGGASTFDPSGETAYLLLSDPQLGVRLVEAIDLISFLVVRVPLGSNPASVGLVPATNQVFVAQNHPLGRVTFIDQESQTTRTLTGFALNSQVIE